MAKDKGKGKETKPCSEAKDAAEAKDATTKAKEVEFNSKEADPEDKDAFASQPSKKEYLPPLRLSIRILFFLFLFFFYSFPCIISFL